MKINASLESKLEANKVQTRESNLVLTLFLINGSEKRSAKRMVSVEKRPNVQGSLGNGRCAMRGNFTFPILSQLSRQEKGKNQTFQT